MGGRDRGPLNVEFHNRRSPTTRKLRRILKRTYKISLRQHISHDLALDADALAVNYPHGCKSFFVSFGEVGFRYGTDVLRTKRMQIERIGDLDLNGFGKWIFEVVNHYLLFA